MKRFALLPLAFLLAAAPALLADFPQEMAQADLLHKHDAHEEARTMLEAVLAREAGGREQAEIYWRLARAWLNLGDQAEDKGAKGDALLSFFAKGEELAQKGIEADPGNHLVYYWKSATAGRWGQVKGILNALSKARPMRDLLQKALSLRPDHADSYYVLGQLYEQVPGGDFLRGQGLGRVAGAQGRGPARHPGQGGGGGGAGLRLLHGAGQAPVGAQLEHRQAPEGAGQEGRPVRRQGPTRWRRTATTKAPCP